jgi:hypothetical protein
MALADVEEAIYNPKRGSRKGLRARNIEMLKKTAGAVKDKAGRLVGEGAKYLGEGAKYLGKVATPVAAAALAENTLRRQASLTPQEMQQRGGADVSAGLSGVESVAGGVEDVVNTATSPLRALTGTPEAHPFTQGIPKVRAAANAAGSEAANLVGGRGLDLQRGVRTYQSELGKYQQEGGGSIPTPMETATGIVQQGLGQGTPNLGQLPGAPQAVRQDNYAGTGLSLDEGYQLDGSYGRTLRNAQGDIVGQMDTQRRLTTDSPEKVAELAGNVASSSQQRAIAEQQLKQQADPTYQREQKIKQLEEQLATPGRGLRQSFSDLLTESQNRRAAKDQLKALHAERKSALEQQGQTERADITSQDKLRDRALRYRELLGKEDTTAKKERRDLMSADQKVFEKQADERKMSPQDKAFFVASNLELGMPGSSWDTSYGKVARKDAMAEFVKQWSSERGIWDWAKSTLGIGSQRAPTQDDIEHADFSGFKTGEGEMNITPDMLTENRVLKSPSGDYVYLDKLPPKVAWLIGQRVIHDNPKNYKDVKQTVRKGQ